MLGSRERENTRNACPIKYIRDGRQVKGIIAFIDVGTVDPSAAQRSLSPCRQYPCQHCDQKVCQVYPLSAVGKMCAKPKRSQLGTIDPRTKDPTCLVTTDPSPQMAENKEEIITCNYAESLRKTPFPAPELGLPPMEVKLRGQ